MQNTREKEKKKKEEARRSAEVERQARRSLALLAEIEDAEEVFAM